MLNELHVASGRHLAAARILAGLTQAQVAKASGLHRNAVSYWERRSAIGRSHAVTQIERALEENGVKLARIPAVTITLCPVKALLRSLGTANNSLGTGHCV